MAALVDSELSFDDIEEMLLSILGGRGIVGTDTEDYQYSSVVEMWKRELSVPSARSEGGLNWYTQAEDYWEEETNCPATDNGVLGGYGALTPMDVRDSNMFFAKLKTMLPNLKQDLVADLGAGCGRVSKHFLLPLFQQVHLFEQSARLVREAPAYIGSPDNKRVTYTAQVLQDFCPEPCTYDVIWIQWVIGHLHDLDFIAFFRRCAIGLKPGGVIVLKDNVSEGSTFMVDKDDSSVARCKAYMHLLLTLSGLNVALEQRQADFPEDLCPVHMWALTSIPPPSP